MDEWRSKVLAVVLALAIVGGVMALRAYAHPNNPWCMIAYCTADGEVVW